MISGELAVTRTELDYWGEDRGLIKIGGASTPSVSVPKWIVVEGFDLRYAHPGLVLFVFFYFFRFFVY